MPGSAARVRFTEAAPTFPRGRQADWSPAELADGLDQLAGFCQRSRARRPVVGEGFLGSLFEAAHRPADHDDRGDSEYAGDRVPDDEDRASDTGRRVAERVRAEGVEARPQQSAGRVRRDEAGPVHLADPGEERGEGPQYRDEPAEEDDLHAMPGEQIAPDLEFRAVQADVTSVALGQP